jgi:6-phosphogluconolactonase (cycloisomerase 2 family)
VILDPTSKYVLMPDLGGDLIHVFGFDSQTLALTELSPLVTDPGTGPRHGAFWTSPSSGELFLFFGGELDQNVYAYKVTYKAEEEGLEWSKVFEIPALGVDGAMPNGTAPLSEVSLSVSL